MLKRITVSASEALIETAKARAREEGTTLNAEFRRSLEAYGDERVDREKVLAKRLETMKRLQGKVVSGRKFTRDEISER